MTYIGVDISKTKLDVDLPGGVIQVHNDAAGIAALLGQVPQDACLVVEATGPYASRLCHLSQQAGIAIALVNPAQSRYFARLTLSRNKTDALDASRLTQLGQMLNPPLWQAETSADASLRQLRTTLELLQRQRTAAGNALQALEHEYYQDAGVRQSLQETVDGLDRQIQALERKLTQLVAAHWPEENRLLQTIPGIGAKTAALLLAVTRGFTRLQQAPKLLAFLGLCPQIEQSGGSQRSRLSKMGLASVRRVLYMCARSAKRWNAACRAKYERLRSRGKPHKLAMCAVASTLIRQACGVIRSQTPFSPTRSSF